MVPALQRIQLISKRINLIFLSVREPISKTKVFLNYRPAHVFTNIHYNPELPKPTNYALNETAVCITVLGGIVRVIGQVVSGSSQSLARDAQRNDLHAALTARVSVPEAAAGPIRHSAARLRVWRTVMFGHSPPEPEHRRTCGLLHLPLACLQIIVLFRALGLRSQRSQCAVAMPRIPVAMQAQIITECPTTCQSQVLIKAIMTTKVCKMLHLAVSMLLLSVNIAQCLVVKNEASESVPANENNQLAESVSTERALRTMFDEMEEKIFTEYLRSYLGLDKRLPRTRAAIKPVFNHWVDKCIKELPEMAAQELLLAWSKLSDGKDDFDHMRYLILSHLSDILLDESARKAHAMAADDLAKLPDEEVVELLEEVLNVLDAIDGLYAK
eukprot:1362351-Prymnesium_polylepis.1